MVMVQVCQRPIGALLTMEPFPFAYIARIYTDLLLVMYKKKCKKFKLVSSGLWGFKCGGQDLPDIFLSLFKFATVSGFGSID